MVVITSTEEIQNGINAAQEILQNRRALLSSNFTSQQIFTPGSGQSQDTEYLFPDKGIDPKKVDISIPKQYDAVATKNHVNGGTLIQYQGVNFYSISSFVAYAISIDKTSISIFLEEGVYDEFKVIGDGTISITIVGASRQNSILNFSRPTNVSTTENSGIFGGSNTLITNLTINGNQFVNAINFGGSLSVKDNCAVINCNINLSGATTTNYTAILGFAKSIIIQGCSIVSTCTLASTVVGLINITFDLGATLQNISITQNRIVCGAARAIKATGPVRLLDISENNITGTSSSSDPIISVIGEVATPGLGRLLTITKNSIENTATNGERCIVVGGEQLPSTVISENSLVGGGIFDSSLSATRRSITISQNSISIEPAALSPACITVNAFGGGDYRIQNNQLRHTNGRCIVMETNMVALVEGNQLVHQTQAAIKALDALTNAVVTGNRSQYLGATSATFLECDSTLTDAVVSDNMVQTRVSGTGGRLITATSAGTNIITGNRVIAGGATFLSFATGTNIVANNLSS
jgi:hypothetical protein